MTNEEFILMLSGKYYRSLYQYARKICDDKSFAEDIVQETFLIAYQKAEELKTHENISAWLYQTARYRMLHALEEKLYYEELSTIAEKVGDRSRFEEGCISELDLYPKIVEKLNPQDLRLILRHYEEGYSYSELAEEYQTSTGSIKMRMQRIRKQLRENLSEYLCL